MVDDTGIVLAETKQWIRAFVVGWNMCPFVRRAFDADLIRYKVGDAGDKDSLLVDFTTELRYLNECSVEQVETTVLIHPYALTEFRQYNAFLDLVDSAIAGEGLDGTIQVASFHPNYCFAGAHPDAIENHTNRSPYPMLHLLRESSVADAVEDYPEVEKIPARNIETLRRRGVPVRDEDVRRDRNPES